MKAAAAADAETIMVVAADAAVAETVLAVAVNLLGTVVLQEVKVQVLQEEKVILPAGLQEELTLHHQGIKDPAEAN